MKATIRKVDGTVIEVEGTEEELRALLPLHVPGTDLPPSFVFIQPMPPAGALPWLPAGTFMLPAPACICASKMFYAGTANILCPVHDHRGITIVAGQGFPWSTNVCAGNAAGNVVLFDVPAQLPRPPTASA